MAAAYRIFTISSSSDPVSEGARVDKFTLKSTGITIPAIIMGKKGRGCARGILPVQLPKRLYKEWQKKGSVTINAAEVGQTKAGHPKLVVKKADTDEKIIGVFRTPIGFRGGNSHTGDRTGETGKAFHPFPGEKIISGMIAQRVAGRIGFGKQLVAVMPKDVVFRTSYSGRLSKAPSSYSYKWNGKQLLLVSGSQAFNRAKAS